MAGATVSSEEYHALSAKFQDLNKKHQEALQRVRYVERKNVAVMQKNKEMKESVVAWQRYHDRHLAKQQKSKAQTTEPIGTTADKGATKEHIRPTMPSSLRPPSVASPPRKPTSNATSLASRALLTHLQEAMFDGASGNSLSRGEEMGDLRIEVEDDELPVYPDAASTGHEGRGERRITNEQEVSHDLIVDEQENHRISSSQTTEDEPTPTATRTMQPPPQPESDDRPEIVSERSLKRKRGPAAVRVYRDELRSDGTPSKPFRIKEEPNSSPPAQSTPYTLQRKETYDLDELGPNAITTPTWRRLRNYSRNISTLRHQRSTSVPLAEEHSYMERLHNSDDHGLTLKDSTIADLRALSEPMSQNLPHSSPLQPISPNIVSGPSSIETPNKRCEPDTPLSTKHRLLAESGEEPPPMDNAKGRLTPQAARARFNNRKSKHTLTPSFNPTKKQTPITAPPKLESTAPTSPSPAHTTTTTPSQFAPVFRLDKATHTGPNKPTIKTPSTTSKPPPNIRIGLPNPKPNTHAPKPALRTLPIPSLKLSDFLPNPLYNANQPHLFHEPLRTRDQRACAPGCVRPTCCGPHFRTLASALPPLSPTSVTRLLETHLGDAFTEVSISQLPAPELEELVLQARTKEMADRHGKHRQRYERPRSPPGFWRNQFPSTQEEEDDRRVAVLREREVVAERRAEAMRRGGRWVFRDEVGGKGVMGRE
ncbi:hypothetical protein M011DRAFT_301930 [Sporormia fimetaria CBS 119925]|uniref:DNA endonuclease activator Ctp1 C-terminal domain-containing protein n=1 Tax=Sporormia fimetaria CBS 119925 TaxID=1340428 RepID=A0A6A6UXW5_9PLEO|nr:hypothetical protein M011DRAFT_301930 [Sporormia fimetaria CBS 119925]